MYSIGDIIYDSYIHQVGEVTEIINRNGQTLYQIKWAKGEGVFHENFIRAATAEEQKTYFYFKKQKEALEKRKMELSNLSFRYFEVGYLSPKDRDNLTRNGYFCYDLRDWDNGMGFDIEHHVAVNNIGSWITDCDLSPYMNNNGCSSWIGIDELGSTITEEIPYSEISKYVKAEKN